MTPRRRVVVDTSALISRLLLPNSIPARAVRQVIAKHSMVASDATIMELAEVLARRKFDAYVTIEERKAISASVRAGSWKSSPFYMWCAFVVTRKMTSSWSWR